MISRRRFTGTCLAATGAAALPACDLLRSLGAPTPTAELAGLRMSDLSLTGLTLLFDVNVKNPYGVALPLANVDFSLASSGRPFLKGQAPLQGAVPASGQQLVTVPAALAFAELFQAIAGVQPGAIVPYHTTLGLSVNAPAIGVVRLPLEKDGQLPVPAVPDVSIASLGWTNVSLSGATGQMRVRIGNTNQFPIDLLNLNYGLQLAGFDVARSTIGSPLNLAPGAAGELAIALSVSTATAGMALFRTLQSSSTNYSFGGTLGFNTPFGPLNTPWSKTGTIALSRG